MAITLDAGIDSKLFPTGKRMRITVMEPAKQIRHTVAVEVRYYLDNVLGVQFVHSSSAGV